MMEWLLEAALLALLTVTLFHAVRLERALGVLRRDRGALETLIAGFNESTARADQSIERLRSASEGAGRQVGRQIDAASLLRQDLALLVERGGATADRLDLLVRGSRSAPAPVPTQDRAPPPEPLDPAPRLRSQAERDLVKALRLVR